MASFRDVTVAPAGTVYKINTGTRFIALNSADVLYLNEYGFAAIAFPDIWEGHEFEQTGDHLGFRQLFTDLSDEGE